ncbi:hypothetical protein VIBNIAM115_1120008 [Vibrio nigripulchritudo AM115]|nr:hypothetical protein VIBNIAM115_1120008 [Vibrio nigripulchritudo AM115]
MEFHSRYTGIHRSVYYEVIFQKKGLQSPAGDKHEIPHRSVVLSILSPFFQLVAPFGSRLYFSIFLIFYSFH